MQPQDLLIALLLILEKRPLMQKDIAARLGISRAAVSYAMKRLVSLNLLSNDYENVMTNKVLDFIKYAIDIVFPAKQEGLAKGIPTAVSGAAFKNKITSNQHYVWKHNQGTVIGQAISPLYFSVPNIVVKEPELYEVLTLIDAIRIGNSREKNIAYNLIHEKLSPV